MQVKRRIAVKSSTAILTSQQQGQYWLAAAAWAGISTVYGWGRPYAGFRSAGIQKKVKVFFSPQRDFRLEVDGNVIDIDIPPGANFTLADQETNLLRLSNPGDWIEIFLDQRIVGTFAHWHPNAGTILRPTFDGTRRFELEPDIRLLSIAHIFRRACLGASTLSDIEADTLAHLFAAAMSNAPANGARRNPLDKIKLDRIFEYVEESLNGEILLSDLAGISAISPFHFTRLFKAATGMAPYQYVLARRLERAKNLLLTTTLSVREIGWSLGVDNVSHFRRKFIEQFGVRPSEMRPQVTLPALGGEALAADLFSRAVHGSERA